MSPLTVVALVLYLLARSGEGVRSINLDRWRWRMDLSLLFPVFWLLEMAALVGGGYVIALLGIHGYHPIGPEGIPRLAVATVNMASSINAGIVEEIVVLGYLVRRLEQRGYSGSLIVLLAVVVRVSYHLYYGWGALAIAIWALASVLLYRRVRRLWPFIICHCAYDAALSLLHTYSDALVLFSLVMFLSSVTFMVIWGGWVAERNPPDVEPRSSWP